MNEAYAQALIDALVAQRNAALDEVAKSRAENAILRSTIEAMKKAEEPAAGE